MKNFTLLQPGKTGPLLIQCFTLSVLAVLLATAGCSTIAPPPRVTHASAPGKLAKRDLDFEMAGAGLLDSTQIGLSGNTGYAITDHVIVEGGLGGVIEGSLMTFVGTRIVPWPIVHQKHLFKLTLDFEVGTGLGVGGEKKPVEEFCPFGGCGSDEDLDENGNLFVGDDLSWYERFAFGQYVGMGLGFNVKWFDFFTRIRYQLAAAENIALTQIYSFMVGLQATLPANFRFYFGGTLLGYTIGDNSDEWVSFEFGIGKTFSL